jgi:hypothetical protein
MICEVTSNASPKQANRPLRLTHHKHEYDSEKIHNIGLVITTQDLLLTPRTNKDFTP